MLEEEKSKRVAHLREMGARKLRRQTLARGWQTWQRGWAAERSRKNLARRAAGMLSQPRVVACLSAWRRSGSSASICSSHRHMSAR